VAPPDWVPSEVRAAHLRVPAFVLLEAATSDDAARERRTTARIEALIQRTRGLDRVSCERNWCLYRAVGAR